jgi:hypothetical protein
MGYNASQMPSWCSWQRGTPPPVSVHDCYCAVQLIDQAYEMAGQPYGAGRC